MTKQALFAIDVRTLGIKKRNVCTPPSLRLESSPAAFSFLEGIPVSNSPAIPKRLSEKCLASLADNTPGSPVKASPPIPKNLLPDLEVGMLGLGSKIAEIDRDNGIKSSSETVSISHLDVDNTLAEVSHDTFSRRKKQTIERDQAHVAKGSDRNMRKCVPSPELDENLAADSPCSENSVSPFRKLIVLRIHLEQVKFVGMDGQLYRVPKPGSCLTNV